MALSGSCNAAFGAPPGHDGGVGRQAAFQYFVSADNIAAFGVDETLYTGDEITLQLVLIFQAFLFDAPQKTVVYAPFRPFPRNLLHRERSVLPKPPWFVTNKTSAETFRRLTYFELDPNPRHLPGVVFSAMRGAL